MKDGEFDCIISASALIIPVHDRFQEALLLNLMNLRLKLHLSRGCKNLIIIYHVVIFNYVFAILHNMHVVICIYAHGPYDLLHE